MMETLRHNNVADSNRLRGVQPSPKRIYSFDWLKAICAFLVVCIHCPFNELFGEYIKTMARCAVPPFFMISGFFYFSGDNGGWKKQTNRIALIILGSNILYFAWSFSLSIYGGYVGTFVSNLLNWKKWCVFIVLNDSMFSFHLWYLGAILYVTLIYRSFKSIGRENLLFYICPILIVGSIVLGKYSKVILGVDIPLEYSRNWFFVGLPYYTIGAFFFDKKPKITWGRNFIIVFLVLIFSLLGIIERFWLISSGNNAIGDIFIATPVLALIIFVSAYNNMDEEKTKISEIGRKYTTSVYVFHIIVDKVILFIVAFLGCKITYGFIRPIFVYAITLLLATGIKKQIISNRSKEM